MRFFLKLLGFLSIATRIAVVFSPFAFMLFGGDRDFAFIESSHQVIFLPILTVVFAFVLFIPEIYASTMRYFAIRSHGGFRYRPDEDDLAKKQSSNNNFDWMTPGTADYALFHGTND